MRMLASDDDVNHVPIIFWVAALFATAPHIFAVLQGSRSTDSGFGLWMLGWSLGPILVAVILAIANARAAAWGWLVAVTVCGYVVFASVFVWPQSSTAALALIWAPLWNFIFFGPIGAVLGTLFALRR
jgi:hypothetical protein